MTQIMQMRVPTLKTLKSTVESISSISDEALIGFYKDEVRISVFNLGSELEALLKFNPEGFFRAYYHCARSLVIRVSLSKFTSIIKSAEDNDQMVIVIKDKSPIRHLDFHIYDSKLHCKGKEKLQASETPHEILNPEQTIYEFKVGINRKNFEQIVLCSVFSEKPIYIIVTGSSVTLQSGSVEIKLLKENESDCNLENIPSTMNQKLELDPSCHPEAFIKASLMGEIVSIRFQTATSEELPPLLEFSISEFFKLFILRKSNRDAIWLVMPEAKTLKNAVRAISLSNEALINFMTNEVRISAANNNSRIRAMLKISSDLLHEYELRRCLIISVDLMAFSGIISSAEDDDQICIFIEDENPITLIQFRICNPAKNKYTKLHMKASDEGISDGYIAFEEIPFEFRIGMDPRIFGNILIHSAIIKEPITINVTSTEITLAAGNKSLTLMKENEWESKFENEPREIQYKIQLCLHHHAEAFVSASQIAHIVNLKDSKAPKKQQTLPTTLEFSIGDFCKLLFFFAVLG